MANQTGPRTPVGKINSSRNALKKGIYTNAALPGEDPQALEELALDISESYAVNDAAGEILVRRFLQHTLQTNRLQAAQVDLIEAKMYSHANRQRFCVDVNLSALSAGQIPDWYFTDDTGRKDKARVIYDVFLEASYLKKHYSPDLMVQAKSQFPNLWQYLMGSPGSPTQKVYATLGERLASLYSQSHPQSNIQCLMDKLKEEKYYELLWGENEARYKAVIAGLRASAVLDVISDPNWSRAEGALHRRSQDLLGSLVTLRRENATLAKTQSAPVIENQPVLESEVLSSRGDEPQVITSA